MKAPFPVGTASREKSTTASVEVDLTGSEMMEAEERGPAMAMRPLVPSTENAAAFQVVFHSPPAWALPQPPFTLRSKESSSRALPSGCLPLSLPALSSPSPLSLPALSLPLSSPLSGSTCLPVAAV